VESFSETDSATQHVNVPAKSEEAKKDKTYEKYRALLVSRSGFLNWGTRPPLGATQGFSGGHE